jgi:hypothetical protein
LTFAGVAGPPVVPLGVPGPLVVPLDTTQTPLTR